MGGSGPERQCSLTTVRHRGADVGCPPTSLAAPDRLEQSTREDGPVMMQGFPPPPEQRVTLSNWQLAPYNRWSFHHVREVVPSARVARGTCEPQPLPVAASPVGDLAVVRTDGSA